MNDRDRFANYVHFRVVDRPPRWEWAFRDETTELWYGQGLPKVVPNKICWAEYFDLDRGAPFVYDNIATEVGVNVFPLPDFSQEVLKERDLKRCLKEVLKKKMKSNPLNLKKATSSIL